MKIHVIILVAVVFVAVEAQNWWDSDYTVKKRSTGHEKVESKRMPPSARGKIMTVADEKRILSDGQASTKHEQEKRLPPGARGKILYGNHDKRIPPAARGNVVEEFEKYKRQDDQGTDKKFFTGSLSGDEDMYNPYKRFFSGSFSDDEDMYNPYKRFFSGAMTEMYNPYKRSFTSSTGKESKGSLASKRSQGPISANQEKRKFSGGFLGDYDHDKRSNTKIDPFALNNFSGNKGLAFKRFGYNKHRDNN